MPIIVKIKHAELNKWYINEVQHTLSTNYKSQVHDTESCHTLVVTLDSTIMLVKGQWSTKIVIIIHKLTIRNMRT